MGDTKNPMLGVKGSVSDTCDRPIKGSKFFSVRKNNTIVLGADTYRKHEAEKILWYLIEYLGPEKIFKKLAEKLDYEVES